MRWELKGREMGKKGRGIGIEGGNCRWVARGSGRERVGR